MIKLVVSPRKGTYAGAPQTRTLSIVLEGWTTAPSKVTVNGKKVDCDCSQTEKAVSDKAVSVNLPQVKAGEKPVSPYSDSSENR